MRIVTYVTVDKSTPWCVTLQTQHMKDKQTHSISIKF